MERVVLLLFVMLFFFTGVVSTSGQCNSTGYLSLSSNISAGTCNFENGTCDYYIRSPWQRNSSYILDKYYQPIKARDGGHYIVMDRHSPFIDSYGRFVSGDIPPGDYCLTFWYYITFSAVRLIGNTTTGTVFCNVTEQSLDTVSWKSHTVELHENTTFQISFTSIHVQYDWYVYKHTSLVDDIVLNRMVQFASTNSTSTNYSTSFPMIVNSSYTSMPANSTKVFATTTAAQYNVTSLSNSCSYFSTRGSCSFSSYSDTCGYTYGSKWSVNNGTYLISYYGTLLSLFGNSPGNDTIYMRLYDWEYSNKNKELLSPCLVAGNYCLDFWYNLPTNEVDMHISVGDKILRHLPTSSNWRNVFVQFSANDDFKLNFSYSGYSSRTTLFAVDDIKLYSNEAVPSRSPYCPVYTSTNITNNHTQETLKLEDIIHHGCTNTGWNITIDMNLMKQLYPNITSRNIYFGDNSCRGKQSGPYLIYQQGFRDCLTSEKISGSTFIYENELVSAVFDIINPSIIRRHDWTFTVECRIDRNVVTSSHVIHNVSSHHVTETNHYNVDLAFYSDPNFMTQLTGNPIHSQAGSYLYTKVYSTVSDWSIKMRLHTCYTDTESDVSKNTTYYLIKDGCEVDANTHIISQSTHETRFVFQDFEYSSDKGGLYVHCDATFCKSDDFTVGCRQSCNPEQLLIG